MAQTTTETKTAPGRRTLRAAGRKKRALKMNTDPAFKKAFNDGKSTRSIAKKAAFRKKKKNKK